MIKLITNSEEFASNSSTTTSDDTTSLAYGPTGSLFGEFATFGTGFVAKRVQFTTPVLPTDVLTIEVSQDAGVTWASIQNLGFMRQDGGDNILYGIGVLGGGTGSNYCTLMFGKKGLLTNGATYGANGLQYSTTWRWRVRKSSSAVAQPVSAIYNQPNTWTSQNTYTGAVPIVLKGANNGVTNVQYMKGESLDGTRLWYLGDVASVDSHLHIASDSGVIVLNDKVKVYNSGITSYIGRDTLDGADTGQLSICAGGADLTSRGAIIALNGNEYSGSAGHLYLSSGTAAGATVYISPQANLVCLKVYSVTVTNAPRVLNVDANGIFGYVSSIRASKNKIDYSPATSFIYDLKPVSFEYRLRNEAGEWLEETDGHQKIGLIAEDVDLIKPEMTYKSTEGALEGVDYPYLIPALLAELQKLRREMDDLKQQLGS